MYYEGFYDVIVGFFLVTVSLSRRNNKSDGVSFIRRYNKEILLVCGIIMIVVGSVRVSVSLVK
jgi:cytochrome c biogenesis protein CcdA